jgi:hypothetical protein
MATAFGGHPNAGKAGTVGLVAFCESLRRILGISGRTVVPEGRNRGVGEALIASTSLAQGAVMTEKKAPAPTVARVHPAG